MHGICSGLFGIGEPRHPRAKADARDVPSRVAGFAYRDLWNVGRDFPADYSALAPENFTTLAHFSVSSAMNFPKSAGEPEIAVAPNSEIRALILGSARAALISLLSLSTIPAGVFLGAPTPIQGLISNPGTNSRTVGTSGKTRDRSAAVTAKGRTLPPNELD